MDEEPVPAEEPAEVSQGHVEIEYSQPITSPYEGPIATVLIGTKSYGIPVYYLENIPQLKRCLDWDTGPDIVLGDVNEDIGHTLIHFLYTGQYETLNSGYNLAREYQRCALAYETARRYGLLGLEAVARKHIEHFGALVHLQDVLETARVICQHLPSDETWFKDYLKESLASSFNKDRNSFREELNTVIGQGTSSDRTILQLSVDILFGHISELEEIAERVAEPASAAEPEPGPEFELDPVPFSEPLSEPEVLPKALSDLESGLKPEPVPEPEYHSHGPLSVGDFSVNQPAEEVVNVGFPEEGIPISEPEIPDAPEYIAEAPLNGVHQATSESPRPDHPLKTYDVSVASLRPQSPVEKPADPEELYLTWRGSHRKKDKKKKKKKSPAVVEEDHPPSVVD
ncbi:hypothetical protein BDV19DRAFT_395512 [Aspergillus venezuelensis]